LKDEFFQEAFEKPIHFITSQQEPKFYQAIQNLLRDITEYLDMVED